MAVYKSITFDNRKKIAALYAKGMSISDISDEVGVALRTLYVELKRGATGKLDQNQRPAYALIDKQVRASVTNFPRILNKLQGFGEDKQEFLDKLSRYDLLVIDDLGVERDTSYSVEQVFNVIDARSRTGKPLIVTTNLSLADLQNPSSLGYARIYDRILEMCPIRLKLAGDSRRTQNAQERRDKAKRLLGLERT